MGKIVLILLLISGLSTFLFFKKFDLPLESPKSVSINLKKTDQVKAEIKSPTIEEIFSSNHPEIVSGSSEPVITLIVTGDVIPARSVNYQSTVRNNFKWPFEKTADFLKTADITFINLETPLIKDCPITQEGMVFCGSSRHIEGLTLAGVDIASLGNNHAGNHGNDGVLETIELLKNNGIDITGNNYEPTYKTVKGIKFAFLGFNDIGGAPSEIAQAIEDGVASSIKKAKENADVVIVQYHWGAEYRAQPDTRQLNLGHFTIDQGADLVIGNHPHWIQPIQYYKGKLITYAHGNFVFDQEWSQKTKEGVAGKYTFIGKNLADVEYFPVEIKDYGQPYFLEGEKKQKILDEMYNESLKLK